MTGAEEKSSYIGNFQVELELQWIFSSFFSDFRRNARIGQENGSNGQKSKLKNLHVN